MADEVQFTRRYSAERTRPHRLPAALDWAIPLLIAAVFVTVLYPATFRAYQTFAELWTYNTDDPYLLLDLYNMIVQRMVPPLTQPGAFSYGLLFQIVAALLLLPFLPFIAWSGGEVTVAHLVLALKAANFLLAAVALLFVYRIARLLTQPLWSAIATLVVATMFPFAWATLAVKPDMAQVATGLAAVYYLLRYQQHGAPSHLYVAAICAGLSAASKYYNILFLVPAAVIVVAYRQRAAADLRSFMLVSARLLALCSALVVAAFLAVNYRWVYYFRELPEFLKTFLFATTDLGIYRKEFWATPWALKFGLLTDTGFIGVGFLAAYVAAALWFMLDDIRKRRLSLVSTINIVVLSFVLLFFIFWNFVSHIRYGWRFLLQTACLMPIPVVVLADRWSSRFGIAGRVMAVAVLAFAFEFVSMRLTPAPALTAPRITVFLDYLRDQFLMRETDSRFTVRDWVRAHVPPGSTVLGQWQTNIAFPANPDPNADVMDGLTLKSSFGFVEANLVREIKADYIVMGRGFSLAGPTPGDPYKQLDAIRKTCPAPGPLVPVGEDRQIFVMRCSLGKPSLGPALASAVVSAKPEAKDVAWGSQRGIGTDGSALGDWAGAVEVTLAVPSGATVLSGKIPVTADTGRSVVIVEIVWHAGDKEIARKVENVYGLRGHPIAVPILSKVPSGAERMTVHVRTWRPQDGRIAVGKAAFGWYRPDPPVAGQWPLLD